MDTPGRNIVLCCDGTSNEFCKNNSNVVKLYEMLEMDPAHQICFYDPGVGTLAASWALLPTTKLLTLLLGLAFGWGLMANVEDAYTFLMNNWRPGDRIFIFGFSRGAYTARAIAAMIHKVGLLHRDNEQLVRYASKMFTNEHDMEVYEDFKHTFGREVRIHFLGLWDTVKSLGWVWSPTVWPFTMNNESVDVVRHALAIDEKRAFFRQNMWGGGSDVKQVWFAGSHCDVGGSYPEEQSGLSQIALDWMVREAEAAGLLTDAQAKADILAPATMDYKAPTHPMAWYWMPAEFFPKVSEVFEKGRWVKTLRMNLFRPRSMPDPCVIHESVQKRLSTTTYRPSNMPANRSVEA